MMLGGADGAEVAAGRAVSGAGSPHAHSARAPISIRHAWRRLRFNASFHDVGRALERIPAALKYHGRLGLFVSSIAPGLPRVTRYVPADSPVDIDPAFRRGFQDRIVRWYRSEGRDLPWRSTSSAYQVAVSEILLQQTQVVRVMPVFQEFVARWPRVHDLHAAPLPDVKKLTDPLGYHIRGTWLKEMARIVVERHGGRMPDSLEALRELPGLGPYAAAAVYVFGLRRRAALLDTNVARVLTRAVGLPLDGSVYRDDRRLRDLAEQLVPARRHYDYHQGLMDLGATVCLARAPRCDRCPLRRTCRALTGGPPVAVWHEHGVVMAAERTVGYRVGSRAAVNPSAKGSAGLDTGLSRPGRAAVKAHDGSR